MEKKDDEKKPARKGLWAIFKESMDKANSGCGPGCGCHDADKEKEKQSKNAQQGPGKDEKQP